MQFIRRARKENPDCVIVACGCFTQISDAEAFSDVQILLGSREKASVAEHVKEYFANPALLEEPPEQILTDPEL